MFAPLPLACCELHGPDSEGTADGCVMKSTLAGLIAASYTALAPIERSNLDAVPTHAELLARKGRPLRRFGLSQEKQLRAEMEQVEFYEKR